jgi:phospholipid-binding lipoprotein MlaA
MNTNKQQWVGWLAKRFLCLSLVLGFSSSQAAVTAAGVASATATPPPPLTASAPTNKVYADTPPSAVPETPDTSSKDPLEGFNRPMFAFNEKLDKWLLKPVATFYNKIMPKPLNEGVNNFFKNINTVPTIANDILQLNFYQSLSDMWRVGINTTVGVGGLFDMATRMQLKPYKNDFGLTMAYWGYDSSSYLVLPFFGSSTIRDGIGLPVDYFVFSVYPYVEPPSLRYQLYGLGVVDRRAALLQYQSVMEEVAIDKYAFMRDAYLQHRHSQMEQNLNRDHSQDQSSSSISEVTTVSVTDSDASA